MTKGRKLTDGEKAYVWNYAIELARKANPGASVDVTVEDELDDNGQVHWRTMVTTEHSGPHA